MINAVSYLALLAYGMMNFAEKAGCLMGIPEDLMGLTVTAAGASCGRPTSETFEKYRSFATSTA